MKFDSNSISSYRVNIKPLASHWQKKKRKKKGQSGRYDVTILINILTERCKKKRFNSTISIAFFSDINLRQLYEVAIILTSSSAKMNCDMFKYLSIYLHIYI